MKRGSKRFTSSLSSSRYDEDDNTVQISKTLSYILRHGAHELKLNVDKKGYVSVDDLLATSNLTRLGCDEDTLFSIVKNCKKQRFGILEQNGKWFIRANQGNSFEVKELLTPITKENVENYPICVHGTFDKYLSSILNNGLQRGTRQHIHFSSKDFGDKQIISGMRSDCSVLIWVDLKFMLEHYPELKFGVSENQVLLCEGPIPRKCFKKIEKIQLTSDKHDRRRKYLVRSVYTDKELDEIAMTK